MDDILKETDIKSKEAPRTRQHKRAPHLKEQTAEELIHSTHTVPAIGLVDGKRDAEELRHGLAA